MGASRVGRNVLDSLGFAEWSAQWPGLPVPRVKSLTQDKSQTCPQQGVAPAFIALINNKGWHGAKRAGF
jgi:hypothetical protein